MIEIDWNAGARPYSNTSVVPTQMEKKNNLPSIYALDLTQLFAFFKLFFCSFVWYDHLDKIDRIISFSLTDFQGIVSEYRPKVFLFLFF